MGRTTVNAFRTPPVEHAAIGLAATKRGVSRSEWLRKITREKIREEVGSAVLERNGAQEMESR